MSYINNMNNYNCYYSNFKDNKVNNFKVDNFISKIKPNKNNYNIGFLDKQNTCDALGIANHSNQYNKDSYKITDINNNDPTVTKCPFNIVKKLKNGKIISEKRECSNKQSVYKNNNYSCNCSNKNVIQINNEINKLTKKDIIYNKQQIKELNNLENMCDPDINCNKTCSIKLNKNFQRWSDKL